MAVDTAEEAEVLVSLMIAPVATAVTVGMVTATVTDMDTVVEVDTVTDATAMVDLITRNLTMDGITLRGVAVDDTAVEAEVDSVEEGTATTMTTMVSTQRSTLRKRAK